MPRRLTAMSPRMKLPELSGALWKAYAAGQVTEEEASQLSDLIEARKVISAPEKPVQWRVGSRPPFLLCLDGSPSLLGRRRPIQAHDIYSHLRDEGGGSCCDDRDCEPVLYRFIADGVQMFVDKRWIEVPSARIQYRALPGTPAKRAEAIGAVRPMNRLRAG
jgi:hypothetical protein